MIIQFHLAWVKEREPIWIIHNINNKRRKKEVTKKILMDRIIIATASPAFSANKIGDAIFFISCEPPLF